MAKTATEWAAEFREYVRKMLHFEEAIALMYWDLRTGAPKKGVELRSEAIGTLASEAFAMQTSPQLEEYLNVLGEPSAFASLDPVTQATVREVKREFDRNRKIPADRFKAYVVLTSQAESVWEEAKRKADFALFRPYLEKIVAMKIEFIGYWGFTGNRYNTLLDQYEPGLTVEQVDGIFGPLRAETVKLVQAIVDSGRRPDLRRFQGHYPKDKQRALSIELLRNMGYDFSAGRLDETEHP
ncbi:MAG: carboxypeptidase M32, partial [Alicyclobacillus sp.]|nr:carboxypeptidase M32 [Alicyclobacillus sp.]